MDDTGDIEVLWRGAFTNDEIHPVHAAAFGTRVFTGDEWDWVEQCNRHSLGWVVARKSGRFVGFANVAWDGFVHAFVEDVFVDESLRGRGVGTRVVAAATDGARTAGCEWLHVGFDETLRSFYVDACGFTPTGAGLIALTD